MVEISFVSGGGIERLNTTSDVPAPASSPRPSPARPKIAGPSRALHAGSRRLSARLMIPGSRSQRLEPGLVRVFELSLKVFEKLYSCKNQRALPVDILKIP